MTGEETLNLYQLFPAGPQVDVHVARHSINLIRDPKFTPLIKQISYLQQTNHEKTCNIIRSCPLLIAL